MPTDHEQPCGPRHRSFCLNGGICYVIPTIPSPFCRCIENYTGARCEEVFLPSSSIQSRSNLSAAFVALAVLATLAVAVLCFLCRKGHLQRASSVQCEISLVETSNTSTRHSYREHWWHPQWRALLPTKADCGPYNKRRRNTTRKARTLKYINR